MLKVRLGSLGFPADCMAAKASEEVDDAHAQDGVSSLRAELDICFNIRLDDLQFRREEDGFQM